ncbi:hypothetical protein ACSEO6_32010, partial [Pseudomonas aeruginosa]
TGSGRINSTMGYRLRWPKKNLTHCPGWVDHYNVQGDVFLSCLYGSELDQKPINLPSSKGSSGKARKNPLFAATSNPLI